MNLTKKIISIFSIVISGFILFQSCAAGVANSLQNRDSVSGTVGVLLVVFMIVGAIIALSSDSSKSILASGIFYIIGGFMALMSEIGAFTDLLIWSIMSVIFGAIFVIYGIAKS